MLSKLPEIVVTEFSKFLFSSKSSYPKSFFMLAKEKDLFKANEHLANILAEEYKRLNIINIRGFDITPHNDNLIRESVIVKHFTNSEIKFARRYLNFSDEKFSISINATDKFFYYFHWFCIVALLLVGFSVSIIFNNRINEFRYYTQGALGIAAILLGLFMTHVFAAPYVMAKKIQKRLNADSKK